MFGAAIFKRVPYQNFGTFRTAISGRGVLELETVNPYISPQVEVASWLGAEPTSRCSAAGHRNTDPLICMEAWKCSAV